MSSAPYSWRFFRAGGFDQPRIDTPADLLAIDRLDQKLWVALSCPVAGSEFDRRTLELIDSDGDGHIRAPELIAAVRWAGARLADPAVLAGGRLTPEAIRADDTEGEAIAAAARAVLADIGGDAITVEAASAAQARFADQAVAAWEAAGAAVKPLGEATAAAYEAFTAVAAKVDDYFTRCRLAAFDERAAGLLNASEDALKALAASALAPTSEGVAALPLAKIIAADETTSEKVGAGNTATAVTLPLVVGVNPAWAGAIATFRTQVVAPLLGERDVLTEAEWHNLQGRFAPYAAWLAAKPAAGAMGDGVLALERLARYCRDLLKLANNFVAFKDFYTHQGPAMFQIGTLYLDGRACELVVAVNDAGKHAALASLSRLCLVYCDCVRGGEKQTIAAAFTAGDSDQLMVGRNGVFYDRQGRDWDATIAKIVDHPISLRQAFWSPYKKLARLVAEQLQKFAATKAGAVETKLAQTAAGVDKLAAPPAPAKTPPTPFDVGKFAGIFAAIGLAVGALGTAVASMLTGLLGLKWWQLPLALAGLLLVVSGPAVVVAWFKLRARNLGPLLDANGWAVNARARINIPFGTSLTQLAALPANAERSLADPYAEKQAPWKAIMIGLFILAGALLGGLAFVAH
jgi:DNA uptake protein ComE-like DNA-binding protein